MPNLVEPVASLKKVLLVDDQAEIRHLMALILNGRCETIEADCAAAAWERILADKPDGVILDVMMPGEMDGYMLCEKIKADPRTAGTIVVLVTARGQLTDKERGKDCGADGYVVKPFSPMALATIVLGMLNAAP